MSVPNGSPVDDQQQPNQSETGDKPKDSVSYETHRKLLDEKKKIQAKLEAIEAEKRQAEEADLVRKGETQKLLDLAKKEAEELRSKLTQKEQREMQAKKMSAVIRGLGTSVDEKWYGVLGQHIDDVVLNPDTGEVEMMSVTSIVDELKKTWPEMLKKPAVGMPADAPKGDNGGMIERSAWLKLSAKDMAKYRPEQILG